MSNKKEDILNKWNDDDLSFKSVTNSSMICRDCINRYDKPAFCSKYPNVKPSEILLCKDGAGCEYYEREE